MNRMMIDLESKQKVWADQLPLFKENYILTSDLDLLEFDMINGQFDIKPNQGNDGYDDEDSLVLYHSVNTAWAMWLRCNRLNQAEIEALKAKTNMLDEGWVMMPREFPANLAEKLATKQLHRSTAENDKVWIEIAEKAYQDNLKMKKFEIIRTYKELIEAVQENGDE